ncbi:MAG: hypothetical protein ACXVBJ_05010 [Flavisolibacter sp.]
MSTYFRPGDPGPSVVFPELDSEYSSFTKFESYLQVYFGSKTFLSGKIDINGLMERAVSLTVNLCLHNRKPMVK